MNYVTPLLVRAVRTQAAQGSVAGGRTARNPRRAGRPRL